MALGVAWAVVGYALASLLGRGQLVTTIITAAAGGLGLGAGAVAHAHNFGHWPELFAGTVAVAVIAGLVAFWWLVTGHTRRRHGSAAIASTRFVIYREGEDRPKKRRPRGP